MNVEYEVVVRRTNMGTAEVTTSVQPGSTMSYINMGPVDILTMRVVFDPTARIAALLTKPPRKSRAKGGAKP